MPLPRLPLKLPFSLFAGALCLVLAGCEGGPDGLELNGGLFSALGLDGKSQTASAEPKLPERPGLVIPPSAVAATTTTTTAPSGMTTTTASMGRLPPPGSGAGAASLDVAALPVDPETKKVQDQADAKKRQVEYCREALRKARVLGQDEATVQGPLGSCKQSILDTMGDALEVNSPIQYKK